MTMDTHAIDAESTPAPAQDSADLRTRFTECRALSDFITSPLSPEDCTVQSMPDVSPAKWHLAHTTWFFETFVLAGTPFHRPSDPQFAVLYNSYYNSIGDQFPRPRRGLLTRPALESIRQYRDRVDGQMLELLESDAVDTVREGLRLAEIVELGIQHEQQHQELMLTDIKHVLSCNPLGPIYRSDPPAGTADDDDARWLAIDEGVHWIGHAQDGFAYDNESPRHRVFLQGGEIRSRPVRCGEFMDFIADGGYERPELWLSEGWHAVSTHRWRAPLYWTQCGDGWEEFTLAGPRPIDRWRPCCHVSYFEADAFARWAGGRLPTEAEWEVAAGETSRQGNFADLLLADNSAIHPASPRRTVAGPGSGEMIQAYGDVWEWTGSQYLAYPGYAPPAGALGEYNGKFMCNQFVLRGGSCATSSSHIRRTYRNFFPPDARWQFSGFRLARD